VIFGPDGHLVRTLPSKWALNPSIFKAHFLDNSYSYVSLGHGEFTPLVSAINAYQQSGQLSFQPPGFQAFSPRGSDSAADEPLPPATSTRDIDIFQQPVQASGLQDVGDSLSEFWGDSSLWSSSNEYSMHVPPSSAPASLSAAASHSNPGGQSIQQTLPSTPASSSFQPSIASGGVHSFHRAPSRVGTPSYLGDQANQRIRKFNQALRQRLEQEKRRTTQLCSVRDERRDDLHDFAVELEQAVSDPNNPLRLKTLVQRLYAIHDRWENEDDVNSFIT